MLWATYTPNTFLSFSQKNNGYIFYSMKDTGDGKTPGVGKEGETFEQLSCCSILCMPFNECTKGCPITVDDEHFIK